MIDMKYILKMAFRNIGRNRRRTILSATAISIAVMVVLMMNGYVGGIKDSMFDNVTKIETGHIKIEHAKYHEKADMMPLEYMIDGFNGEGYKQVISAIEDISEIKTVAPRIKFGVLLSYNGKSRSAMGIGIEPATENEIMPFNRVMVSGEYFKDANAKSIIMGSGLAGKLGVKTGDKLTIVARSAYDSIRGMTFSVTGIFRYGIAALDDKLFYVPIISAARLLEMGNGVNEIIIMVDKPENAKAIAAEIRKKIQAQEKDTTKYYVASWREQGGWLTMFEDMNYIYNIIYIGFLILASTVIINTTMMVIYERIREIGTIGALGMSSREIVLLFTLESALVSIIGSFCGVAVGGALDFLLSKTGINILAFTGGSSQLPTNDIVYPRFGLWLLTWSFLYGVVIATAVAYIPARRSAKIEPVEALRSL